MAARGGRIVEANLQACRPPAGPGCSKVPIADDRAASAAAAGKIQARPPSPRSLAAASAALRRLIPQPGPPGRNRFARERPARRRSFANRHRPFREAQQSPKSVPVWEHEVVRECGKAAVNGPCLPRPLVPRPAWWARAWRTPRPAFRQPPAPRGHHLAGAELHPAGGQPKTANRLPASAWRFARPHRAEPRRKAIKHGTAAPPAVARPRGATGTSSLPAEPRSAAPSTWPHVNQKPTAGAAVRILRRLRRPAAQPLHQKPRQPVVRGSHGGWANATGLLLNLRAGPPAHSTPWSSTVKTAAAPAGFQLPLFEDNAEFDSVSASVRPARVIFPPSCCATTPASAGPGVKGLLDGDSTMMPGIFEQNGQRVVELAAVAGAHAPPAPLNDLADDLVKTQRLD